MSLKETEVLALDSLLLSTGEGLRLEVSVGLDSFEFGHDRYDVRPSRAEAVLDISRTSRSGYAMRLRFSTSLVGPCMRCLRNAEPEFSIDAREVHQLGGGEELESPYVDTDEQLALKDWARDALSLALPAQIICHERCAGLCPECGVNLNDEPDHHHDRAPDSRWDKLSELNLG